jgi:hypothetical protein
VGPERGVVERMGGRGLGQLAQLLAGVLAFALGKRGRLRARLEETGPAVPGPGPLCVGPDLPEGLADAARVGRIERMRMRVGGPDGRLWASSMRRRVRAGSNPGRS